MHDEETSKLIKVGIEGSRDEEANSVKLVFKELEDTKVDLTDSSINDIKTLFDRVFDYMVSNKQLVRFELDDAKNDLYHDVSKDIIDQLNSEIAESKDNIEKIWALTPKDNTEQNEEEIE